MNFKPDQYEKIVIAFYKFAKKPEAEINKLIGRFILQRKNV